MRVFGQIKTVLDCGLKRSIHGQIIKRINIVGRMHGGGDDNAKINLESIAFLARLDLKHILLRSRLKQVRQQWSQRFRVRNHILVVFIRLNIDTEEDLIIFEWRFRFFFLASSFRFRFRTAIVIITIIIRRRLLLSRRFIILGDTRIRVDRLLILSSRRRFLLRLIIITLRFLSLLSIRSFRRFHLSNLVAAIFPCLSLGLFIFRFFLALILHRFACFLQLLTLIFQRPRSLFILFLALFLLSRRFFLGCI
mmetsp:Transcript_34593/g.56364  ORF Transcript_34593/g.56364 Transcript_34593/m.56364 type:complete len:251 (-) Transcript_34593:2258-3010(-)